MSQYSFEFVKKLNTDKENEFSSVQLQGSFDAALGYVHLVKKHIVFCFVFQFDHIRFGSKHKVKEKAQMFARRQISTASRPIYLTLIRFYNTKHRV
jgi:hypothetical protein